MPELVAAFRRPIVPLAVSRIEKRLADLGARFDHYMIGRWMRGDGPAGVDPSLQARLDGAWEFYRDPRFLDDPDSFFAAPPPPDAVRETARGSLAAGLRLDVELASPFTPVYADARADYLRFAENRTVHALWFRHDRPGYPTAICLHGYASGDPRIDALAFGARRLYAAGLDVVLYTLPFHGRRRPRRAPKSGHGFFGPDMARTNEAFAQTIADVRALMRHVERRGSEGVGAFGMSLGAYATALLAAVEPRLAFAVAMIPVASLPELVWGEPIHRWRRAEIEALGVTLPRFRELWQVHAPLRRRPLVPRARRFVVGALGDRICPPGHAHALWDHWERPGVHWYPGGHLAQFRRSRALGAVRRFLGSLGLAS